MNPKEVHEEEQEIYNLLVSKVKDLLTGKHIDFEAHKMELDATKMALDFAKYRKLVPTPKALETIPEIRDLSKKLPFAETKSA